MTAETSLALLALRAAAHGARAGSYDTYSFSPPEDNEMAPQAAPPKQNQSPAKPQNSADDPYGLLGGLDMASLASWHPGQRASGPEDNSGASALEPHAVGLDARSALSARALLSFGEDFGASFGSSLGASFGTHFARQAAQNLATASAGPTKLEMSDYCLHCGGNMGRGTSNLEYECADCGLIVEGDTAEPEDGAPREMQNTARLRIVGPNSNQLQPDLYRSSSDNTAATQKKIIYEEYVKYNQFHVEAKGRAISLDAFSLAAELYNSVQKHCVKRSQNKKAIMAACLWRACVQIGFVLPKTEIATFMQLAVKGIARGDNFIRALHADGKMESLDVHADPCKPEIVTLFTHLGLDGPKYAGLRDAVFDIVQTAVKEMIGTSSVLRSKVAGATFVVLRRCKDHKLVPKPPSLQEFCDGRIRKNTVERMTRQLDEYHSHFVDCYTRAGLDAAPPSRK
jgi:transcription initiation factor TFIIIB Brf1 subunit/transcription initiation factor TFIIB